MSSSLLVNLVIAVICIAITVYGSYFIILICLAAGFCICVFNIAKEFIDRFKSSDFKNTHIYSFLQNHFNFISKNTSGNVGDDPARISYLYFKGQWIDDVICSCEAACFVNLAKANSLKDYVWISEIMPIRPKSIVVLWKFVGCWAYRIALYTGTFIWCPILFLVFFTVAGLISAFALLTTLVFKLFELLLLNLYGLFNLCKHCHNKITLPIYECPNCHAYHKNLISSSKYGVFYRTCSCGCKIPVLPMLGKSKLKAICRNCGTVISTNYFIPVTIAFLGGVKVGKTSFFNSLLACSLKPVMDKRSWKMAINGDENNKFKEMQRKIEGGVFPASTQDGAIEAFCVNADRGKGSFPLTIYFYDPPGETFQRSLKFRTHKYYDYLKGVIWVIDPLSIDLIKSRYSTNKNVFSSANASECSPEASLDRWLIGQENYFSNSLKKTLCAVVITKADVPFVSQTLRLIPGDNDSKCRNFLREYCSSNFIQKFEKTFSKVKFFVVSSSGGASVGQKFKPQGIDEVMQWMLDNIVE